MAIMCEDVDIARCLPKIMIATFTNPGQICILCKRIYVHERIYDQLRVALVKIRRTTSTPAACLMRA
jgi:acyl-CoA reductase-like NAD-dependent aldehyde dehydrogenase